ncbi:TPA: hypothetical protein ACH4WM_005429, partial [Escherichia coli]
DDKFITTDYLQQCQLYIPDLEKRLTMRCSTSRFAPWTAFKSRLCGFAAQKYSTKPQLKSCR